MNYLVTLTGTKRTLNEIEVEVIELLYSIVFSNLLVLLHRTRFRVNCGLYKALFKICFSYQTFFKYLTDKFLKLIINYQVLSQKKNM